MKFDAIIVLGHHCQNNVISEISKKRVEKGIKLYAKEKSKIIMAGGFSLSYKKDPGFREARLMKRYAIRLGVPSEDILIEERSRNTQGNAYFTKQIVKSHSWKRVAVATSHSLKKAKFLFEFVYGDGYLINYFVVKSGYSKAELKTIAEKEKKSIKIIKEIYKDKNIQRGDDKKIGILLKKLYNSHLK